MWTEDFTMGRVERWTRGPNQNTFGFTLIQKQIKFHGQKLSRENMSRFKGFSLNLLSTVCPNLTSPRRQDFPSVHVSHVISFHKRRGEVDALQYLFFKLIFCDCLVTNAVYTHQKTQQKRENIYIYITILNISNPAHPEITDVNTLVNSLCILYSYRQRYRL